MVLHRKNKKTMIEQIATLPLINKITGKKGVYPVNVWVYQDYGSGGKWMTDKAARKTYENREVYELKSDGSETQPVAYNHLTTHPSGEPLLILFSPEKGVYHPMKVDKEDYKLDIDEGNWVQWMSNAMRQQFEEWKQSELPWYKRPEYVVPISTGIFIFLTMLGFTYYWQNGLTEINGMVDAMIQSGKAAAQARP